MRLNKEFRLNYVADEAMLVKAGGREADMSKVFGLNEPAAWLYEQIGDEDVSEDRLVELLTGEFEVDEETARKDIGDLINEWKTYGIVL